ncbi:APC family permease [Mycolicibacterium goodii]|uniref:APC family permease n=1 Tax=Mycolicibacterium goodii TaxID=134601 RepID=A0ABS6HW59_MYCGD|nr:APC family permease [Mycolicibacterium goodii]MBU8826906.1 APC family permease [Mycolicibacterium goodii]MBU8836273.1 APC family permease [Mycolicibacterium goodii]
MDDRRGMRSRSPVWGLRRGQLSFAQVLAQSVSAVAPSAVMVTLPALVLPAAGGATLGVFVVTALLMAAVGYCAAQFSTRMVAVSGVYSYTVKGLGPIPGIAAGWSVIIGYAGAAMASTLGAASYLTALLGRLGVPDNHVTTTLLAVVVGVVALALMVRGIRLSARIMLTVEVFAIVAASAVLIIAFTGSVTGGHDPPKANATEPYSALGFALLLAITSYVGFESAGTVAREAQRPFVTVTRAIRWTPLALGVLYTFAAAMQSAGGIRANIGAMPIVLMPESAGAASTALSIVMELGITASWFACVIGSTTALSRTLFAMGREGVVSHRIGHAHRAFRTPHIALCAAIPVIVAVPICYLLISGSTREVLIGLLAMSAHGYIGAYLLVCLATPAFLRRIGELTVTPLVVGLATAVMMTAIIGWAALTVESPVWIATAVYAGLLATGFGVFAVRRRTIPDLAHRVGVFDETVAGDVFADYNPWEVRR